MTVKTRFRLFSRESPFEFGNRRRQALSLVDGWSMARVRGRFQFSALGAIS